MVSEFRVHGLRVLLEFTVCIGVWGSGLWSFGFGV